MGAQFTLRDAVPDDAGAAAGLIVAAFSHQPVALDPPASALRETAESLAAQWHTGGGLVAEVAGRLVGVLMWVPREETLYVSRLSVDPAWRRRGIARALLAAAESVAHRCGVNRITLATRLTLTGNRALFAAAGFREVSLETHQGYAAPTSVAMERRLEP